MIYDNYYLRQGFLRLLVREYREWRQAIGDCPSGGRWTCFKYAWSSTHTKRDVERSWQGRR